MKIEKVDFSGAPDRLTGDAYDCVWVRLAPREEPGPFSSPALQWLDWQMQGKLSELLASGEKRKETTFFPTMRKLPVPYVAVDQPGSADWQSFLKNCQGMQLKRVLYFCEESGRVGEFEKELKRFSSEKLPEVVAFGSDR